MTHVDFVLLNHNSGAYVEESIEALEAQTSPDWELLVVDNASTDGSLECITDRIRKSRLANWDVVQSPVNLHFAGGMNLGISKTRAEIVVPLNSDVYLGPRFVELVSSAYDRCAGQKVGSFVGQEMVWDWQGRGLLDERRSYGVSLLRRLVLCAWHPEHNCLSTLLATCGLCSSLLSKSFDGCQAAEW